MTNGVLVTTIKKKSQTLSKFVGNRANSILDVMNIQQAQKRSRAIERLILGI